MAKLQMSLKARALKYLSAREHSRLELARKLQLTAVAEGTLRDGPTREMLASSLKEVERRA